VITIDLIKNLVVIGRRRLEKSAGKGHPTPV